MTNTWTRLAIGAALLLITAVAGSAQSSTTGDWTASMGKEADKIHLNFERRTEKGNRNQMGQSYSYTELQGLSREQAEAGGPIKFSLVREAGRIDCEGRFENRKGSGTFTFTPNQN